MVSIVLLVMKDDDFHCSSSEDEPFDPDQSSSSSDDDITPELEETQNLLKEISQKRKQMMAEIAKLNASEYKVMGRVKAFQNLKKKELERRKKREDKPPRRKNQPVSSEVRHLIAKDLGAGLHPVAIAEKYSVSENFVRKLLASMRKSNLEDEAPPRKITKPGPKSTFANNDVIVVTLMLIEEHPSWKLETIVRKLEELLDINSSTTALSRFLRNCKITWKEAVKIPVNWNSDTILQKRKDFINHLLPKSHMKNIVWIDEAGFNLDQLRRSKGRAVSGQKISVTVQAHSRRLNVISSLGKDGIILNHFKLSTIKKNDDDSGGVNARDFKAFLFELATKVPRQTIFIMDNAKIHHSEKVVETFSSLLETFKITVMFLPPYSPFINPIELCFNTVRTRIAKEELTNSDNFRDLVQREFDKVTPKEVCGYIKHAEKYYEQCRLGLPFTGKILSPDIVDQEE